MTAIARHRARHRRDLPTRHRAQGFSMIEVLVTLLILLVGLLGIVGMQLLSVQNNQSAYLRTQATYIASDMLDRIRQNRIGQDNGDYDGFDSNSVPGDSAGGCAKDADGCEPSQLANLDMRQVSNHFDNVFNQPDHRPTLPAGRIRVDRVAGATVDEFVVTVSWNERGWDGSGADAVRTDDVERSVELRSLIRDKAPGT
ncbi:MAG: type IV pilus modification protein PilV [Pseudomonadota bacterium]